MPIYSSKEFKFLTKKLKSIFRNMIGEHNIMIKEKYTQVIGHLKEYNRE